MASIWTQEHTHEGLPRFAASSSISHRRLGQGSGRRIQRRKVECMFHGAFRAESESLDQESFSCPPGKLQIASLARAHFEEDILRQKKSLIPLKTTFGKSRALPEALSRCKIQSYRPAILERSVGSPKATETLRRSISVFFYLRKGE